MDQVFPLLGGLGVGLLGSTHCIAMCGGIAGALSVALPPARRTPSSLLVRHACYGLGRVTSYGIAGALAGSAGLVLAGLIGPMGTALLRALAAAFLVALGLYLGGWWPALTFLERQGARVWRRLAPLASRLRPGDSLPAALALGMLWGWLPCGLVYSALALAAATGEPLRGGLVMVGFGLGTLPATIGAGVLADRLAGIGRTLTSRRVAGALVVLFGLWTLAGSGVFGHAGAQDPPCHGTHASTP